MKKIILYLFLFFWTITITSAYQFYTAIPWVNSCMQEYIKQWGKNWYIYKLNSWNYHIDREDYSDIKWFEIIWYSTWCYMKTNSLKYSFFAISNSIYCSVSRILLS